MRVAVCLSGQLRSFRDCVGPLIDNVIKPLNADVFVHTWSNPGISTKLMVYVPHEIHHLMPPDIHHDVGDLQSGHFKSTMERKFPSLYNYIKSYVQPNLVVDAEEVASLYGARKCVVEELNPDKLVEGFDLELIANSIASMGLNSLPMFYKIWACDNLRREAEVEDGTVYDVVIRMRPDYIVLGQFPPDVFLRCGNNLATLHNPDYEAAAIKLAAFDAMAVGTSEAMTFYASLWTLLPEYFDPQKYPEWPMGARGPESILYRHLAKIGAENNTFKPEFLLYRKNAYLDQATTIDMMLADIADKPEFAELSQKLHNYRDSIC